MSPVCCAFAYAIELSLATFSAAARLTGAATFALINDIAARSGSSSPASLFSSSRVSCLYSDSSDIRASFRGLGRLRRDVLHRERLDRDRPQRQRRPQP